MIIKISNTTAIQVNLFHTTSCLDEVGCEMCFKNDVESHEKGAKQLIEIIGDHHSASFLMHLIDEANKKLEKDDKRFGTKFAKIIKDQKDNEKFDRFQKRLIEKTKEPLKKLEKARKRSAKKFNKG